MVNRRRKWIEVENTFLTDVPPIITGRGKNRQRVPNPDIEPKAYYLFTYECRRLKRGISRRRQLQTITGDGREDVESQLMDLVLRDDVIVIENQDDPGKYMRSNVEPVPIAGVKDAA